MTRPSRPRSSRRPCAWRSPSCNMPWARERIPARRMRARRRIPVRTVRARRGIPVRMVQTKEAVPARKAEKSPGEARFIWRMKRCTW